LKKERIEETEQQIKRLEREINDSAQIMADMTVRQSQAKKELQGLKNTLSQLKPKKLVVSDHAILRYAERHHGIDVDGIRREISEKLSGVETIGDLNFKGFIVKGNTVTTYIPTQEDADVQRKQNVVQNETRSQTNPA